MKIQIIQHSIRPNEAPDAYPWPQTSTSEAGAKGMIKRWLEKVAQHHQMEVAPSFTWTGRKSNTLKFSEDQPHEVSYDFELRDLDQ